jgi:hypothetical protein
MSDKITITKKQFERWMKNLPFENVDTSWQSLVAESQKPELIERWAVFGGDGISGGIFETKEYAVLVAKESKNSRIVHLREVV